MQAKRYYLPHPISTTILRFQRQHSLLKPSRARAPTALYDTSYEELGLKDGQSHAIEPYYDFAGRR